MATCDFLPCDQSNAEVQLRTRDIISRNTPSDSLRIFRTTTPATALYGTTEVRYLTSALWASTDKEQGHFTSHQYEGSTLQSPNPQTTVPMPSTPTSTNPSPLEPRLYSVTTQELLRALPSRRDVEVLMDLMRASPEVCYQLNYKSHLPMSVKLPNMRAQIPNLLRPETNLVLLARQMLLFAMALQCISPLRQISELSKHHHLIMADLAESAIKTVTTNESLLGSLEGIGNIVLEAIYHMDCGDLRRAWIAMRRAVMAAQLAGLHRRAPHQLRGLDDRNDLDSEIMWNSIIYMERITSLLSGLPTSTGSANIALQEVTNDAVPGQRLHVLIGNAAGRVLERNQIDSSQQALELTEDIDRALIKLAGQMPTAFWRPPEFAGLARDSLEAFNETRRALSHSSYYTLVIQLHMPYMLCPSHASQGTYSKIACVNASREVLSREIALQTFNPISSCCRMNDFMALIAGMTLMLAHALSHCGHATEYLLVHQRLSDRALVERALECMPFVSELQEDMLVVRCVALLRDLLIIEQEAAREHDESSSHQGSQTYETGRDLLIMRAPFLGGIKISKGGVAAVASLRAEEGRDLSGGVSIGGIGSLRVNSPIPEPPVLSGQSSGEASVHEGMTGVSQACPNEFFMQQDQVVSEVAANFDDWSVLGMDIAFFENVMRGNEGILSRTAGTER